VPAPGLDQKWYLSVSRGRSIWLRGEGGSLFTGFCSMQKLHFQRRCTGVRAGECSKQHLHSLHPCRLCSGGHDCMDAEGRATQEQLPRTFERDFVRPQGIVEMQILQEQTSARQIPSTYVLVGKLPCWSNNPGVYLGAVVGWVWLVTVPNWLSIRNVSKDFIAG